MISISLASFAAVAENEKGEQDIYIIVSFKIDIKTKLSSRVNLQVILRIMDGAWLIR